LLKMKNNSCSNTITEISKSACSYEIIDWGGMFQQSSV
jgi:hypothetical protein